MDIRCNLSRKPKCIRRPKLLIWTQYNTSASIVKLPVCGAEFVVANTGFSTIYPSNVPFCVALASYIYVFFSPTSYHLGEVNNAFIDDYVALISETIAGEKKDTKIQKQPENFILFNTPVSERLENLLKILSHQSLH